jgi:hypothetical protein
VVACEVDSAAAIVAETVLVVPSENVAASLLWTSELVVWLEVEVGIEVCVEVCVGVDVEVEGSVNVDDSREGPGDSDAMDEVILEGGPVEGAGKMIREDDSVKGKVVKVVVRVVVGCVRVGCVVVGCVVVGCVVVGCVVVEFVMSSIIDELAKLEELEGVVTSAGVDSEVVGSAAVELVVDSMVGSEPGWVVEFVDPGIVELAK